MKNKKEKKYKIVYRKWPRELYSSGYESYIATQKLRYYVGKWTEAQFGGLLVFDSFNNACAYLGPHMSMSAPDFIIYECEVEGKVPLPKYSITHSCNYVVPVQIYETLWTGKELPELPLKVYFRTWPDGTEAYKRVKLLKRVR